MAEATIREQIDAMNRQSEALDRHTAALEAFVKAGGKGAASTGGSTSTASTKTKELTADMVKAAWGDYFKAAADEDEKKERIANAAKVAKMWKVAKITDAPKEKWGEALAILEKLKAGEDPFEEEGGSEGDGESLL